MTYKTFLTGGLTWFAIGCTAITPQDRSQITQFKAKQLVLTVNVSETLKTLLTEEDLDGDKKITIDDLKLAPPGKSDAKNQKGDGVFLLTGTKGHRVRVASTYYLANLLQELVLAEDRHGQIDLDKVFERPADRIHRQIREIYWQGLTRKVDAESIEAIVHDDKMQLEGPAYVYVPHSDQRAYSYFKQALKDNKNIKVVRLPPTEQLGDAFVKSLKNGKHGILSLALDCSTKGVCQGKPFVVPGGRFNEMYGWDSYFIGRGLIQDGLVELARSMVDNQVYQINHYGKILNANRTYYLTRSQPPFLTSLILATYAALPKTPANKHWLAGALTAAIKEYNDVWTSGPRLTKTGLSRYHGSGTGAPPETEPGHFDAIYRPYAEQRKLSVRAFERLYNNHKIARIPELERYFINDRAMRESGHDTTYRWSGEGIGCADFATVDLNSLLFKREIDIANIIKHDFNDRFATAPKAQQTSSWWLKRAARRKELMNKYLWDDAKGLFFDYNLKAGKRSNYVSATTLYPLWVSDPSTPATTLVTPRQARRLVKAALQELEVAGGIVASSLASRGPLSAERPARQWDFPYGWAPHQIIAWEGLMQHGFKKDAQRLAYRWLYTITRNAVDYNGTVPEKFDLVRRTHAVFAEYGNVGTKFSYITKEGFGWTNASYQIGLAILGPKLRAGLNNLKTPEELFAP